MLEEGCYRGQEVEEVIPPEFRVAHNPRDQSQDEDDAGEGDEKNHRRHPRFVMAGDDAALGIGDVERLYTCRGVRYDIHARSP